MNKKMLLDMLLLPRGIYQRITDKKLTLYLGVLFVGLVDVGLFLAGRYKNFLNGNPDTLIYNLIIACIFVILLGFVDVMMFAYPVVDFMKLLRKQPQAADNSSILNRVMKIYITVHFLIIPVNIVYMYIVRNMNPTAMPMWLASLFILFELLILPIWFSAAVLRGIKTIYNLEPILVRLVFIAIFSWNYLMGYALDYIRVQWFLTLLR